MDSILIHDVVNVRLQLQDKKSGNRWLVIYINMAWLMNLTTIRLF